ncbi:LuxR C-terminal-related transcriptional regulator [Kibdelosporangium phytohabitans]|uniref:LuxR family transcriptional regulator n=1 Tax=Kibdelosporangium phytohabitans TaxID=860235 RepID=A0A0N7F2Z7_9PSEU|nr:response regulator transcription factor [Kibdelosporangium phytohabitans]ALG07223.1 LuxR family transcriptional regulator [Kibdelosporangium phytohabitans]MBE1471925.1 DNA-binding NarL/FixJ family response regulator [Kibdelosporangium phytohabitans]
MATATRIPVGVIEDHPLYRAAVAQLLADAPDVELDAVAGSVAQFAAHRQHPGGVVVLDLRLPGTQGSSAVVEVVGMGHRVLVLSAYSGRAEVLGAMAAGASGYLSKDSDGVEILHAVRLIAGGNSYVSPMLAAHVLDALPGRDSGLVIELSARERQVLSLVAAGERDQDIAEALDISIRTVRSYLDRIRDKTGQRRRPELTRYAIEKGVAYVPVAPTVPV